MAVPTTYYIEQEVTVSKRFAIQDEDIKTEDEAIYMVENGDADAYLEESEETDWGTPVVVDIDRGLFDYKATILVFFECVGDDEARESMDGLRSTIESEGLKNGYINGEIEVADIEVVE